MSKKPKHKPVAEETTMEEATVNETNESLETVDETQVEQASEPTETQEEEVEIQTQPVETQASTESTGPVKPIIDTPVIVDNRTGQVVQASTPLMRLAEQQAKQNTFGVQSKQSISEMIARQFGESVLNTPQIQYVVDTLSTYVERMSPKAAIEEVEGGQQQTKLAKLFDTVLSYDPELSQVCLNIIVSVVKEHRQLAFDEIYAYRFPNTMLVNQDQAMRFQMLLLLFLTLASGTNKSELNEKIGTRKVLDQIPDRQSKANLAEFLN